MTWNIRVWDQSPIRRSKNCDIVNGSDIPGKNWSLKIMRLRQRIELAVLGIATMAAVYGCEKTEATVKTAPPPPVNVITPVQREVQEYDEFNGRVQAVNTVDIRSHVGGYIQKVNFTDGAEVKAGDVLIEIDPRPFQATLDQANATRQQAQAELDYADRELKRIEPLVPTGGASQLELSKAQDGVARGKASIAAADAQIEAAKLNVAYAQVKSPIDGRVSKSNFTEGNLVAGDTLLTTVVSVNPINVNIDVDERRFEMYRAIARKSGQSNPTKFRDINLPMFVALASETDFPHKGIVDFVDNQVDALTGTIRVRGEFDNTDRALISGQYVQVRVPRGTATQELLVPERAIGFDQDRKYVLVVNDKDIVEYRPIETGGQFGEERAVTKGINAGERIIVDGMQRARPGLPVTPNVVQPSTQPTTAAK
jgi:RND family efflux transporter MFP subunit